VAENLSEFQSHDYERRSLGGKMFGQGFDSPRLHQTTRGKLAFLVASRPFLKIKCTS